MSEARGGARGRSNSGRAPGRKPLADGNADDTRVDIRKHAIRLFNERGYASVSLDEIARAAAVNRATVYYHFQGKEDVFLESLQAVVSFVQGEIEAIVTQTHLSVRERFSLLVHTRRQMQEQDLSGKLDEMDEPMVHEAVQHLSPEGQRRVGQMMGALHGLTHNLVVEGIDKAELRALPPQVIDFAFWQMFPADGYPQEFGLSRAEMEENLLRLFFDGLIP